MKSCNTCHKQLPLTEFRNNRSKCEKCRLIQSKKRDRTVKGLCNRIYFDQKANSKRRGDNLPSYSKTELSDWILSKPNFQSLYDNWVASDYDRKLRPSVDRIDDFKGYCFDNIRLMTFNQNQCQPYPKKQRKVFQYSKELILLNTFKSVKDAGKFFNCRQQKISSYASGYYNHPNFIFSYSILESYSYPKL